MVVVPQTGGYWIDGAETAPEESPVLPCPSSTEVSSSIGEGLGSGRSSPKLEIDETAKCYRKYFVDKVRNFVILYIIEKISY